MKAIILAVSLAAAVAGIAAAQVRPPNCVTNCEPDGWGGQRCVTRCY